MPNRLLCFGIYLVVLFAGQKLIAAQQSTSESRSGNVAARQVENVRIKAQGVDKLFTDISLSYNIPIALEIAAHDEQLTTYELSLRSGTIADLLDRFTKQHKEYAWEMEDGVVNIFPRDDYRDFSLDELLKVQISKFSVAENTSCWKLVDSLMKTVEVQNVLKTYGITPSGLNFSGGFFPQIGRRVAFDVSDMTLKEILNKVIKESTIAKIWLIKKYSSDQTVLILVNSRNEDLPPKKFSISRAFK